MKHLCTGALLVFATLISPAAWSETSTAPVPASDLELAELFTPEPTPTAGCWGCGGSYTTSPGGGAASHWGFGNSCTEALNDLTSQTRAAANAFCLAYEDGGTCNFRVVQTAACWWSASYGKYVVDGYANFSCRVWVGGPGCIIP